MFCTEQGGQARLRRVSVAETGQHVQARSDRSSVVAVGQYFLAVSFGLSAAASKTPVVLPAGVSFGIATNSDTSTEKKTVKFAEPLTTTFTLVQPSPSPSIIECVCFFYSFQISIFTHVQCGAEL